MHHRIEPVWHAAADVRDKATWTRFHGASAAHTDIFNHETPQHG